MDKLKMKKGIFSYQKQVIQVLIVVISIRLFVLCEWGESCICLLYYETAILSLLHNPFVSS